MESFIVAPGKWPDLKTTEAPFNSRITVEKSKAIVGEVKAITMPEPGGPGTPN